jgi:phospholipid-binding lipoprotein MlaA
VVRFVVNTTVGVAGFFDPATHWGLARRDEDMGQMLGRWGVPPGPFLMLPLLGPSNPRDATGMVFDSALSPFTWVSLLVVPLWGAPGVVDAVNARARADERIESARRSALDYYVFVRDAFMQYREAAIRNRGAASDYGSGEIYGGGAGDDLYEVDDDGEEKPDAP